MLISNIPFSSIFCTTHVRIVGPGTHAVTPGPQDAEPRTQAGTLDRRRAATASDLGDGRPEGTVHVQIVQTPSYIKSRPPLPPTSMLMDLGPLVESI